MISIEEEAELHTLEALCGFWASKFDEIDKMLYERLTYGTPWQIDPNERDRVCLQRAWADHRAAELRHNLDLGPAVGDPPNRQELPPSAEEREFSTRVREQARQLYRDRRNRSRGPRLVAAGD